MHPLVFMKGTPIYAVAALPLDPAVIPILSRDLSV